MMKLVTWCSSCGTVYNADDFDDFRHHPDGWIEHKCEGSGQAGHFICYQASESVYEAFSRIDGYATELVGNAHVVDSEWLHIILQLRYGWKE